MTYEAPYRCMQDSGKLEVLIPTYAVSADIYGGIGIFSMESADSAQYIDKEIGRAHV